MCRFNKKSLDFFSGIFYFSSMKTVWIPVVCFVFLSCSKNASSHLTGDEKRLVRAYTALVQLGARMSIREPAYQDSAETILKSLRFTKADYDRSVASLNENPERWETFYREVQVLLSINKSSGAAPR